MSTLNRRGFLRATALTLAAGTLGATALTAPQAGAQGRILGTVIDYAAGVPSAASIKAAGHLGAVRYVSQRRPGTENWMIGKPVTAAETASLAQHGLQTASVYQFGRAETADWLRGA
ncbi:glycoside hydrolase domain-containing protein, partial [Corynebacterium nasicanis]